MIKLFFILSFLFICSGLAQTSVGLKFSTGDTEIDAHLLDVNGYASADISLFRKDLTMGFHASNRDLDLYLVKENLHPADVYYGYVISYSTGRSIYDVMKLYKKKKGWGSIAKDFGIKPGSDEFHRLKNNTFKYISKDKVKKGKDKNKTRLNPGSVGGKGKKSK